jgi:hypothetical protein
LPYPADYRPAFAFSGILYPLARPPSSRSRYRPCRAGAVGLTQLIEIEIRRGEAGPNSPVGHPGAAAGTARSDGPSHVAFWLRPVSLFGRFGVTSPASLHVRSAFHVSPGRAPPRGWQGCRRCPRSFTPWVTPQHVRVGAPKHHRVRPGCPDRHSNPDPCNILPSGVLESRECFWSHSSPSANMPSADSLSVR